MKILHVIPSISPARGGTSRAIIDMVRALRDRGIDAEIATTNDDGDGLLDVPLGGKSTLYDSIPTYFFARFSPQISALREFAFSGSFTTWLFQHIGEYEAIHVHALFSYTSTVAMAIARFRGIPYITTPHGLLCEWSLQQSVQKKQTYLKLIERANLDGARSIHVTCQQEREDVATLGFKSPTFVLPLALTDTPVQIPDAATRLRQSLNCAPDEPIILFLSRLHYKKGLEYLIPALGRLRDRRFTFVIAGNGTPAYEAEIQALLVTSGIEQRTRMVGFVEGERKDVLIQGANLFALTSHSENFGISVLEALAVGTPVLVTPGVGLATIVSDNSLGFVADLDIESIANVLDCCLDDLDRAKSIGTHARQFTLEHFNWDRIAGELIQVYRDLVTNNAVSRSEIAARAHQ
ncbi:glycosyltransferase [Chamaesiphon polymorphus]|uniref:Glycosyl transferase family 1 n=1 Tax=Chamaesiphon polymorphus CCALA 037 TaxID=2107692 RepID=A0A2T1GMA1_9CYAN|nr:glycosyltransferase [Chamaesiphon polymorphus]PSB59027.1 glycosyl transferase family 1 [Chamaesiphon polymorphus CCALA 037]